MEPRLHPDTIEEVKQRVDIVDIVSESVVLKKRGKDYLGLCPFHDEKTPSFSVSPSKQLYYCFGCGSGGNAFKFLMEIGKRSFSTVVLDLAQRYQVPLKTLEPEQRQELERQLSLQEQLYEILALAANFYQHALRQTQGEAALHYFKSERQLGEETIGQFGLGYAPPGWETLYRYLVEQKRYPVALVEQAGLIKKRKSGNGFYDQFRDRLMIPIADAGGRIIGFGGRSANGEEPKYLNSPETSLFDKSKTLFALDHAKKSISQQDRAVVVEGYFDAITLHGAGITNAVASLGTALTQNQLRQLLRFTPSKQIVFNFDADRAGTNATKRAIGEIEPLIYSGQVQLRVLNLPDGKDADDFLKSAADASQRYQQLIEDAPLWFDWQIEQLLTQKDLVQSDQYGQVVQSMVKLLSKIDNQATRDSYIAQCAQLLSQGKSEYFKINTQKFKRLTETLHTQVNRQRRPQVASQQRSVEVPATEAHLLEEAEADLLRIYLHYPEYRLEIKDALEAKDLLFSLSHHRFLWQQIVELEAAPASSLLDLLENHRSVFPQQMAQVAHLFYLPETIYRTQTIQAEKNWAEKTELVTWEDPQRIPFIIRTAIASLERVSCEKYRRYCLQQWQNLDPATEAERMQYYYREFQEAEQRIKELESLRQFSPLDLLHRL